MRFLTRRLWPLALTGLVVGLLAAPSAATAASPGRELAPASLERSWDHLAFQFGPGRLVTNPDSLNEHLEYRQAVAHAVDRTSLAAAMGLTPIDSYLDVHDPALSQGAWAQYDYDPARAGTLIDGLCARLGRDCAADPPVMVLTVREDDPGRVALAGAIEPMLAAAGIELQARIIPWQDQLDELSLGESDAAVFGWIDSRSPESTVAIHDVFDPEGDFSVFYGWGTLGSSVINDDSVRFAELRDLMNATTDPTARAGYIREAEQILADQLIFIPLGFDAGCRGQTVTILGTEDADDIRGTAGPDVIHGLGGDDVIRGLAGDDVICGGPGNDTLLGGPGDDTMAGGTGDDLLRGLTGNDESHGLDGDDRLQEGPGDDRMFGGPGKDKLWGGIGDDTIWGDSGRDQIRGGRDDDILVGGDDTDRIWGDSGDDDLYGEANSDFLYGGIGFDLLLGGDGNDRLFGWNDDDNLFGGNGRDQLRGQEGDDLVDGGPDYDWCSAERERIDCEAAL
jgi:hypothetical protein